MQDLDHKLEASKIEITGLKAELARVSGINADLNSKYMNLKIGNFVLKKLMSSICNFFFNFQKIILSTDNDNLNMTSKSSIENLSNRIKVLEESNNELKKNCSLVHTIS